MEHSTRTSLPSKRMLLRLILPAVILVGVFALIKTHPRKNEVASSNVTGSGARIQIGSIPQQQSIPITETTGDTSYTTPIGNPDSSVTTQGNSTGATTTKKSSEGLAEESDDLAPVITSISATTVANGENITIYGKNFTKSNTILLSIDLPNKFTNIQSVTGNSLRFTLDLTVADDLEHSIGQLPETAKKTALRNILLEQTGNADGEWLYPTILAVQNENGTSNDVEISVNLLKRI